MNLLKWNPTKYEWEQFAEGDKITAGLVDPTFTQDVTITTPESGLILTSPDSTQYRVSVNNDGTLTISNILV